MTAIREGWVRGLRERRDKQIFEANDIWAGGMK